MVLDGGALDAALHGAASDPRTYLLRFHPGVEPPQLDDVADADVSGLADVSGPTGGPIEVEVNAGHWIWRCPCSASGGGVAFVDRPLGWCVACRNDAVGGRWRRLRFPVEREQIERILAARPELETRNWWPGETVDDLARENAEHGVRGGR